MSTVRDQARDGQRASPQSLGRCHVIVQQGDSLGFKVRRFKCGSMIKGSQVPCRAHRELRLFKNGPPSPQLKCTEQNISAFKAVLRHEMGCDWPGAGSLPTRVLRKPHNTRNTLTSAPFLGMRKSRWRQRRWLAKRLCWA